MKPADNDWARRRISYYKHRNEQLENWLISVAIVIFVVVCFWVHG